MLASANHPCRAESPLETSRYAEPINVMTVREVSVYLRVRPSTIYRLLRRHEIPAFHIGSDWRFNIEEIDRWRLARGSSAVDLL